MRISKERLNAILASGHQLLFGLVIGVSLGSVLAIATGWYARSASTQFEWIGLSLAAPVLLAWVSYSVLSFRTEKRASKLAELLNARDTVVRYDGAKKRLIVEQVGTVDCGFGPVTHAVLDRAEMTVQEAEKIGFATDDRPRRLLIGGGTKPSGQVADAPAREGEADAIPFRAVEPVEASA